MNVAKEKKGAEDRIKLSGRFTFTDHAIFKEMVQSVLQSTCERCYIDLSKIEFIDSAGLGMLLIIKEELMKKNTPLILIKPFGQVAKMIQISHFDQLFTIEY